MHFLVVTSAEKAKDYNLEQYFPHERVQLSMVRNFLEQIYYLKIPTEVPWI